MHLLFTSIALALLAPAATLLAPSPDDETAIRNARTQSNQAMARHDVAAFGETLAPDYVAVFGDGAFIKSRAACLHAFQSTFTAVPFEHVITYERITDKVELRDNQDLAAEHGHWIGRLPSGRQAYTGSYLAMWRKDPKGWKLRSELFITLSGGK